MVVSRLGQQAFLHHADADVPGRLAVDGLGDDGIEQATSAHLLDERRINLLDFLAEDLSHGLGILHQMLVLHHLQGLNSHAGSQGESAEGRAMLTRTDVQHDVVVGQTG